MTIALIILAITLAISVLFMSVRNMRRHGQPGCPLATDSTTKQTSCCSRR
ncbi:MAG: hypothetical protein V4555_13980 [Acidobacteriota bacterium]